MRVQPRHNTWPCARLPPSFLVMGICMTSKLNVDSQALWVIDVFGLFCWHDTHRCLYNQELANIWSTGARIKCLYSTCNSIPKGCCGFCGINVPDILRGESGQPRRITYIPQLPWGHYVTFTTAGFKQSWAKKSFVDKLCSMPLGILCD